MAALLQPYLVIEGRPVEVAGSLYAGLTVYLDLLLRWNARTNLTAVREPEQIVRRHFGESLFAASCLASVVTKGAEVMDLGSGAGFPGLPLQMLRPEWKVTLAESQGKKAAFLREAVRVLGLPSTVWAGRVEAMAGEFDVVTLRAVDRMGPMLSLGRQRVRAGGVMLEMGGELEAEAEEEGLRQWRMPERDGSYVRIWQVE